MVRDRDRIFSIVVTRRLRAMGIRDKPTAPASPWQNGFGERLIGSIRREFGSRHRFGRGTSPPDPSIIRELLQQNQDTSLPGKRALIWRSVQRTEIITLNPILGGLHHHYVRI
jgi:hypothetical protein